MRGGSRTARKAALTATGLVQFHIAIVTGDMQAAIERYSRLLGIEGWSFWERMPPGSPTRVAYGHGAGNTWELISIEKDGDSQFHEFYKRHGEGVQHIGFWCPDLRASVKLALEAGGKIVSTLVDTEGNAIVHVKPGDLDSLQLPRNLFLSAGLGFTLEYFGPGGEEMYKDWFKDDYDVMLKPPPWA
jgi:catechol 2,3-dioxygenase-like lactoylglutathione lyase family enzyme